MLTYCLIVTKVKIKFVYELFFANFVAIFYNIKLRV